MEIAIFSVEQTFADAAEIVRHGIETTSRLINYTRVNKRKVNNHERMLRTSDCSEKEYMK